MATATRPAGGVVRFAQESWSELRKVTWPTQEQVIRLTLLVVLISVLVSAYIFAFDNVADLDSVERSFHFTPRGLREHIAAHGIDG